MYNLLTPTQYPLLNSRIDGWKKLAKVNARIVDIYVFPIEVFEYFLQNQSLPPEFIDDVTKVTQKIINESPSHTVLVRRAFVVPGIINPPGPRFLGLKSPQEVITAIKQLFEFVIEQRYHQVKDYQISGWLEPPSLVLDIEKFKTNNQSTIIPYGGYGFAENGSVYIYAVFGINEGVQSLAADRYEIEFKNNRGFIVNKEIPQKNLMLCTTTHKEITQLQVPVESQFEQVLADGEIVEIARVVHELSKEYGPQRVEFSTDEKGICFNEVADYWKEDKPVNHNINIQGVVKVINNIEDFQEITRIPVDELISGKIIIKISENIIINRDYDVLGTLASWKDRLYVLYPGVAATQHAMRILTDKGHRAFLVGNQKFEDQDTVQIVVTGGKVRITNLSRTQNQKYVSLWDASLLGSEICGGKAHRLSTLKILGFQVPHGAVLTTLLFDSVIKALGYEPSISLSEFTDIHKLLENPSPEILEIIKSQLVDYQKSDRIFAVRSSATIEDDAQNSMAGMYDSFLNVSGDDLTGKVIQVIQSAFSIKIMNFLNENPDLIKKQKMAVIIQEMIPARCAGVIFGANVQSKDTDIVEIEAKEGLGEGIVSGEAKEIEQCKFSRSQRHIIEHKKPTILSSTEAKALFMLSERLRSEFNSPQDIEWAIDQNGQIWILQTRDLFLG